MFSYEEATSCIASHTSVGAKETVLLGSALGRVLRTRTNAVRMLPPWDNSAMDGYAVRTSDLPGEIPVCGTVAAGSPEPGQLPSGSCVKIMTGAPIPTGADAVVMRENVDEVDGVARFSHQPEVGKHIRRSGEDVMPGTLLLDKGTKLGPGELAILAAQGITSVDVASQPRVLVLSTGDELVPLGTQPKRGQIINSNNITLSSQIREAGAIPIDGGIIGDSLQDTIRALRAAIDFDVLITSGGVSVGDFDYVKPAFANVGIETHFWKAAIKPGKPVAFGSRPRGSNTTRQYVFGLPGNPASSLVSFELFVRPMLLGMQGLGQRYRPKRLVTLQSPLQKKTGRTHFVRAQLETSDDGILATPLSSQGSGMLRSMVSVDALLTLAADAVAFPSGSKVPALLLRCPS